MKKLLTAMSIVLGLGLATAQHTLPAKATTTPPAKAMKVEKEAKKNRTRS